MTRLSKPLLFLLCLSLAGAASAGVNVWTTNGPVTTRIDSVAIDPSTPATLYAGAGDGSSNSGGGDFGVFKSIDGGAIWTFPPPNLDTVVNALAIDPSNPATLYAGTFDWEGAGGVYTSTDGGMTWTRGLYQQNGVLALAIDPSTPSTLYAGTIFNGVAKSTSWGGDWTVLNTGLRDHSVQALAIDPSRSTTIYAGTSDHNWTSGGVIKSADGGASWTAVNVGLANRPVLALAVDPALPASVYAGTRGAGVFKSINAGASWTAINTGLTNSDVRALAIDPSAPATLYAGTAGGGVFKSTDGGARWTAMNAGLVNPFVSALAIDPSTPARLYAGTNGGVYEYLRVEGPCATDATTLCLNGGRFRVTTEWATRDGRSGAGQAVALTEDSGYFTFFDAANVEALVKILNGCGLNSRYWTFAGGLTDVNVILTVTDTQTGAVQIYTNPQGTPFQPIQDTNAFATCP